MLLFFTLIIFGCNLTVSECLIIIYTFVKYYLDTVLQNKKIGL